MNRENISKDGLLTQARDFIENVHEGEWVYTGIDRDELISKISKSLDTLTWQGLTESEINSIYVNSGLYGERKIFIEAYNTIQKLLKAKNG